MPVTTSFSVLADAHRCADRSAAELNPDEGIRQYPKHGERQDLRCPTLWDLDQEIHLAARRLRRKPHIIRSCFARAGCS